MTRRARIQDEDEIEAFHAQRERILLGSDSENDGAYSEEDEAIMDLPSDSDDVEQDAADGEDVDEQWGKTRRTFYSADTAADDLEDEAREARKLQKRQLASLGAHQARAPAAYVPGVMRLDLELSSDDSAGEEDALTERFGSKKALRRVTPDDITAIISPAVQDALPEEPDVQKALAELHAMLRGTLASTQELCERAKQAKADGLGFLQTKCELLVGYCANLALYLVLQARGRFRQDHPVVERLVRYRLLLEKIKPMEARLQYAVDRLLHASDARAEDASAALAHRPNPEALSAANAASDAEDDAAHTDTYQAPRVAPVHFERRRAKTGDIAEAVASRSRVVADMQAEIEDRPEEDAIDPVAGAVSARRSVAAVREHEAYEEDNFVRFSLSSKERKRLATLSARPVDELSDLNDFLHNAQNKPRASSAVDKLLGTKKAEPKAPQTGSDMSDIEDDMAPRPAAKRFYDDVAGRAQGKKAAKAPRGARPTADPDARNRISPTAARPATAAIMRNRGMTPARPRVQDNPRVAQRAKYEKAMRKLRSFKTLPASRDRAYGGESSGIRTNISRSVRF